MEILRDSFDRIHNYLRVSLTERCNLRCTYCMPEEGIPLTPNDRLPNLEELMHIISVFQEMGVDKIRLTGGEPLVYNNFDEMVNRLGKMNFRKLCITTNGIFLDRHLDTLLNAGLISVNISLDTLSQEKFLQITRRDRFHKVMDNIKLAIDAGMNVKVNTVLIKGQNDEEITDLISWTKDEPIHLRFIEFMPFNGNQWETGKMIPHQRVLEVAENHFQIEKLDDSFHSTSRAYRVKDANGTFALISSMSQPFCSTCNRLRLTTDGKLKNCLFSNQETDLLTALRMGHDLKELIRLSVRSKKEAHAGMENLPKMDNRSMIAIGG